MAEEYVIRIQAEGEAAESKIPVAIPTDNGVTTPKATQAAAPSGGGVSTQLGKMVVAGALMPAVTTLASTGVSMIGLATGNNKLQQKINIGMSVASKAAGLYSNIAGGAAIAGPIGAAVGASVWAIGQAAQVGATVMRHGIEYNNERVKLGVARDRAGIATDRRR